MYISCYRADETNFNHQGQFKVKVDEEENNIYRALNGQFYTTFKVHITDIFVGNLIPRMIVKIPTPNKNNPMQLFRVVDYEEDENGDIIFTAFHIAWDLSAGFLPHINIVGKTRKQAAEYILEKAKETQEHRFNIIDYDNPKEQKNLQIVRYSPLASLMGNKDNTLLNRYEGTEFDFDNFDIIISNRIGQDTGFLVKDNKNIITSNKNLDYKPIATRIIPQGADELLLPEYYIDSPLINNYDAIFYKHVTFNEIGINEDEDINKNTALEMLREAARALFTQQNIDKPYLSWTINFDDMQDNEKISLELRKLLKLDLGDSVIVSKNKLANRLKARILEYNYNFVKGKYKDITISNISKNFTVSLEQSVADINFKVDNFTSIVSNINQTMLSKIEQTEKEILLEVSNKASKSEVSEAVGVANSYTNSTIEVLASEIGQKVSSIEEKQTVVDDRVEEVEIWKKEAEQKITPDAIVNTVTSSTQWKNKGDISRLRLKINYSNLTKESPGEMFLYGVDDNGKDLSNGTVKVSLSGKDYNIPIEQHNPCYNSLDVPINQTIYLCYCTGYKEVFSCWPTKNGWKKLRTSSTKMQDSNNKIEVMEWGTYHVIASYIMSEKEVIKSAVVYDYPVKDLSGMASNAELKILSDEISFKVDKGGIVSAINLSSEAVKIKSTKIQLEGAVTVGDSDGNYVHIDNANYTIRDSGTPKAFFGFKKMDNAGYDKYVVPKLAMGAYGYKSNHNYFTIVPYRGNDNPQGISNAYVDIAYHNLKNDDFSNIKMYDGGDIRLAPVKNLEITTNYSNGSYAGTGENRLAVFSTSALADYNSNLQIGVVANHSNGNGLILADRGKDSPWSGSGLPSNGGTWRTAVRVNTDSNGDKFFRPLDNKGDIALGSGGYPWKSVHSKSTYSSQGVVARDIDVKSINNDNILENIEFIDTYTRNVNDPLVIDVTKIKNTTCVNEEEGNVYINESEMIKLLLKEVKDLKDRVKFLESKVNQ